MKTIREIALELGVSKQTVRNTIANLGLQSSLRKVKNTFAIDEHQENLIKRALSNDNEDENENENAKQFANGLQSDLRSTLHLFEAQISAKDKQLEQKDKQIEQLQKLLDQQQQLQLHTQRQLDQLQLEFKGAAGDEVKEETKETVQTEQTKKKSKWKFWSSTKNKL